MRVGFSVSECLRICVRAVQDGRRFARACESACCHAVTASGSGQGTWSGNVRSRAMTTSLFLILLLFLLRGHGAVNTFADFLGFCTSSPWCGLTWTLLEWSHLDLFSMIGTKKKSSVMYGCGHYRRVSGSAPSTYLILLRILTHSAAVQEWRGLSG